MDELSDFTFGISTRDACSLIIHNVTLPSYSLIANATAALCTAPIYPPDFVPHCEDSSQRWTFDTELNHCIEFSFFSCDQSTSGLNVFEDIANCEQTCLNYTGKLLSLHYICLVIATLHFTVCMYTEQVYHDGDTFDAVDGCNIW